MTYIKLPNDVQYILDQLSSNGFSSYVVGGCVRDSIMCKAPNDWDICTSATPDQIKHCFQTFSIIDTGIKHGTVTLIINNNQYEITTYRSESCYSDGRHPDKVEFVGSIQEDLSRRDFTINAIAYNPNTGIIDPYGGYNDIINNVIRCVHNPDDRFNEDGLRILRCLRFASNYGFNIEYYTRQSVFKNICKLDNISKERINSELCKIIQGEYALTILLQYKEVIGHVIPELGKCILFNQNNKYHIYDVYDHIAHALSYHAKFDLISKLALLLHDVGKPLCYTTDECGNGHFYGHSKISAELAYSIMKNLKFDNRTISKVVELVLYHDCDMPTTVRGIRRLVSKMSVDQVKRLLDIKLCDIYAHSNINQSAQVDKCLYAMNLLDNEIKHNSAFHLKDIKINGADILSLGIPQGPIIGKLLNSCLDAVISDNVENTYESLIAYVQMLYSNYIEELT